MLTGKIMLGNLRRMQKAIHVDGSIKDYRGIVIRRGTTPTVYRQNSCMTLKEQDFTGEWRAYAMQSFPPRDKTVFLNILNFDEGISSFFRWRLMMNILEYKGRRKSLKSSSLTPAREFASPLEPDMGEIMSDVRDIDFFFNGLAGHEKSRDIYHGMELRFDGVCNMATVNSFCREGRTGDICTEHLGFISLEKLRELRYDFNVFLVNDTLI